MLRKFTTLFFSCISLYTFSQQSSSKIFIVSSNKAGSTSYTNIISVDIKAGKRVADLYAQDSKYAVRSNGLRSYLPLQQNAFVSDQFGNPDTLRSPMGGAVACMAYDQRTNRLFYVPQRLSELRYMDLDQKDPSFTYLDNQSLNLLHSKDDVANQISRMTIASDGTGYALTNDGEHLIKFTTQGTPSIQDLGVLIDKPGNGIFVRSSCTSWGGDMVADNAGNLILITQSNYVFKITPSTKIAEFVGKISGVPQAFTSNGAAVNEDGELVLSCGNCIALGGIVPFYKISDFTTLVAVAVEDNIPGIGNISDMASSNLLFQKKTAPVVTPETTPAFIAKTEEVAKIQLPVFTIYPNPISRGKFTIKTTNITDKGEYKMAVLDVTGRAVMEAKMNLGSKSNTNTFNFPSGEAKGIYTVLVVDFFGRTVYSQQLIVE